jgi:glycosyltransferase involved in cell wall biosynthesis
MTQALPTFSISIETANLADTSPARFARVLKSLADQDYPITNAQEVVVADTGRWPEQLLREMCAPYPWLTIVAVEREAGYTDCKMQSVPHMTGEIVFFCDADVIYEPGWLRLMLTAFNEHPEIKVIGGDTGVDEAVRESGVFGLAMAIVFLFPPFSDQKEIRTKHYYEGNNVGFRRELLLRYPAPTSLPVKRANLFIHNTLLKRKGFSIWHQPRARGHHPLPKGITGFVSEFWNMGRDSAYVSHFFRDFSGRSYLDGSRLHRRLHRAATVLQRDPKRWLLLPLALPIILLGVLIYTVARACGLLRRPPKPGNLQEIWGDALPN